MEIVCDMVILAREHGGLSYVKHAVKFRKDLALAHISAGPPYNNNEEPLDSLFLNRQLSPNSEPRVISQGHDVAKLCGMRSYL